MQSELFQAFVVILMIIAYSLWKCQILKSQKIRILHEIYTKRILNTELSALWKV